MMNLRIILSLIPILLCCCTSLALAQTTQSPYFLVNGFSNFSASSQNQSSSFEQKNLSDGISKNHFEKDRQIGNDSQFFFKTGIKKKHTSDRETKYELTAKAEFNVNSVRRNENPNLDQIFISAKDPVSFLRGTFEVGNYFAVNQKMKVGPARFARGAGGINGKYLEYVNLPILADSSQSTNSPCSGGALSTSCSNIKLPNFILLPQSPIGHGGYAKSFYNNDTGSTESRREGYDNFNKSRFRALKDDSFDGVEDATKISYYTPRIEGLQLGISYAPNSNNRGFTANTVRDVNAIRIQNIVSFGANYSEYFDNLGFAISATGEKGEVKNSKSQFGVERNDLSSYDIASTIEYFGFSFGASYGSWGKSLTPKNGIYSCEYDQSTPLAAQNCNAMGGKIVSKFDNPFYYSAGIAYQIGPAATSLTGLRSKFQNNDFQAISLGLDYKLKKNLMPYFEVTRFAFRSNQPSSSDLINQGSIANSQRQVRDNQGYVFLSGILLSF